MVSLNTSLQRRRKIIEELKEMEETLSREELLELLEKGIAYHNQDLSWEERNLVETYLKKAKGDNEEGAITLENHLAFRKTLLLYDWIKGSREIETKAIEEKYGLYGGAIYRLGEGFSWLADSLAEIAGNEGWGEEGRNREEDLNKIKILSNRLIEGIKEEELNLAKLYIPGLSRYYIRRLLGAGYGNEESLKGVSEGSV